MTTPFSPERSAAIRAGLIAEAAAGQHPGPHWWRAVGLLAVGVLAGAGAATAAFAAGTAAPHVGPTASPGTPATGGLAAAPPGVIPGTPIISMLGSPSGLLVTRSTSLDVSGRPKAATHVRVTVTCLAVGETTFGTDPGGNNSSMSCSAGDLNQPSAVSFQDLELTSRVSKLYFSASAGGRAAVSVQFENQVPTRLGVNANGETYGAESGPEGQPDLVAVSGTDASGNAVDGYARSAELHAFSPDHPAQPTSPAEAVRLQAERDRAYPNGWEIPVYDPDGTTRIGSLHIG